MKANATTESEASTKWCPDARAPMVAGVNSYNGETTYAAGNRENWKLTDGSNCVGSRCMAWRWLNGSEQAGTGRGYCGRAGRP